MGGVGGGEWNLDLKPRVPHTPALTMVSRAQSKTFGAACTGLVYFQRNVSLTFLGKVHFSLMLALRWFLDRKKKASDVM